MLFPKVTLKLLLATFLGTPIASNTGDGCKSPALHAEPLEAHIFRLSNSSRSLAPSTPKKHTLEFPGSLFSKSPFILILGILSFIFSKYFFYYKKNYKK